MARTTLTLLAVFTALLGGAYPACVTGLSQLGFASPANGSLLQRDGTTVGSELIGQRFVSPGYFWSRPSATTPHEYNAAASTGSNLGPLNPALLTSVATRAASLRGADARAGALPVELVTASASGLDPHLSPQGAKYQAARVAAARGIIEAAVLQLIDEQTRERTLGLWGEPTVNVLMLNLALDRLERK